jgi:hypothetical protein
MKRIKLITYENFPFGGAPVNFLRYLLSVLPKLRNNKLIFPNGVGNFI